MKKKLLLASCLLGLAFGLVACGNNVTNDKSSSEETVVTTETAETTETTPSPEVVDTEDSNNSADDVESTDTETTDSVVTEPVELTDEEQGTIEMFNDSSLNLSDEDFLNAIRFTMYCTDNINVDKSIITCMGKFILYCLRTNQYDSVADMINDSERFPGATEAFNYHNNFGGVPSFMTEGMLDSNLPDNISDFMYVEASDTTTAHEQAVAMKKDSQEVYGVFVISEGRYIAFFTE